MRITIASGKGGTGKTTVAVNLAYSLAVSGSPVILLDCDVEEPNDHLFLRPEFLENRPVTLPKPVLEASRCNSCGRCVTACRFNAIALLKRKLLIFPELCHACGVCSEICPEQALHEEPQPIGTIRVGRPGPGLGEACFTFIDGTLNIGESQAPAVVRAVKRRGVEAAGGPPGAGSSGSEPLVLIDASPGTACPVVEALR
ncbi:MAG: 4Fe-4S binding protein, partial [Deltaproteobacteria bacterium]|nr:4Fe-4S binding protein [Deltaproteobacteria bacterium]